MDHLCDLYDDGVGVDCECAGTDTDEDVCIYECVIVCVQQRCDHRIYRRESGNRGCRPEADCRADGYRDWS